VLVRPNFAKPLARCLAIWSLLAVAPTAVLAWEPNASDLEAAIESGQFGDYLDNLTAWLNAKSPTGEAALRALLDDATFVNALDQRQLIFKTGAKELGAFAKASAANRAFLAWLLRNTKAMDLYLLAVVPLRLADRERNDYRLSTGPLDIWRRILEADPGAKSGLYLRLAIATALRPPGTGNRGAGMAKEPVDPVARYLHFKTAYDNKELFPSFENLTVWEYEHVVSSCASNDDLAWARKMINTWRPDLRVGEQVVKSTSEVQYRRSPFPYTDYKSVIAGGGKCGPRSSWAVMICQAFGIPAIGVRQPGHVCVAYKSAYPFTDPQPGNVWKVGYGRGWQFSRLEGMPGPEFLAAVEERAHRTEFSQVEHLRWLASALASPTKAAAVMEVANKIRKSALEAKKLLTLPPEAAKAHKPPAPPANPSAAPAKPTKVPPSGARIEASAFSALSGVRVLDSFAGGKQVNFPKNTQNSWVDYPLDVEVAGVYTLAMIVATPNFGQVLNLTSGRKKLATIKLPNTTGLWGRTQAVEIRLPRGRQVLRVAAPYQRGVALRRLELKLKSPQ